MFWSRSTLNLFPVKAHSQRFGLIMSGKDLAPLQAGQRLVRKDGIRYVINNDGTPVGRLGVDDLVHPLTSDQHCDAIKLDIIPQATSFLLEETKEIAQQVNDAASTDWPIGPYRAKNSYAICCCFLFLNLI